MIPTRAECTRQDFIHASFTVGCMTTCAELIFPVFLASYTKHTKGSAEKPRIRLCKRPWRYCEQGQSCSALSLLACEAWVIETRPSIYDLRHPPWDPDPDRQPGSGHRPDH